MEFVRAKLGCLGALLYARALFEFRHHLAGEKFERGERLLGAVPGREVQQDRRVSRHGLQFLDLGNDGCRRTVQDDVAGQRVVVARFGADILRHGAEIAGRVTARKMRQAAEDDRLAFAPRFGVAIGDVNPARDIDVPARRIAAQRFRRLFEVFSMGRG